MTGRQPAPSRRQLQARAMYQMSVGCLRPGKEVRQVRALGAAGTERHQQDGPAEIEPGL